MTLKHQLEALVEEMVTRGLRYDEAHREFEKRFIARVLTASGGNVCKAADQLGMHRNTLTRKLTEHGLRSA